MSPEADVGPNTDENETTPFMYKAGANRYFDSSIRVSKAYFSDERRNMTSNIFFHPDRSHCGVALPWKGDEDQGDPKWLRH